MDFAIHALIFFALLMVPSFVPPSFSAPSLQSTVRAWKRRGGIRTHVTFVSTRSAEPKLERLIRGSVIVRLDGRRRSDWTPTGEVRAIRSRVDVVWGWLGATRGFPRARIRSLRTAGSSPVRSSASSSRHRRVFPFATWPKGSWPSVVRARRSRPSCFVAPPSDAPIGRAERPSACARRTTQTESAASA